MGELILLINTVAKTVGVSPALLVAICMTETNLRNVHVMNDGGSPSYGVCQVKLETAQFMGKVFKKKKVQAYTSEDMKKVEKNLKVAALYVKYQINRYDGDLCKAVAAYNAGSFRESSRYEGRPFNWKYVEKVRSNLEDEHLTAQLDCGPVDSALALNK